MIDGLFTEILSSDRTLDKSEVQFDEVNGQIEWSPIVKVENKQKANLVTESSGENVSKRKTEDMSEPSQQRKKKPCHEVITLDSDDEDEPHGSHRTVSGNCSGSSSSIQQQRQPIELSLSDDDDDAISSIMDFTLASRSRSDSHLTPAAADPFVSTLSSSDFMYSSAVSRRNHLIPGLGQDDNDDDDDDDDDIAIIEWLILLFVTSGR